MRFPYFPRNVMNDRMDLMHHEWSRLTNWFAGITEADVLRWQTQVIENVIRPGYIILASVHLVIWFTMRVMMKGRATNGRQRALARFMLWKAAMWLDFWLRTQRDFSVIYHNTALIIIIVGVLGSAIEVMVRFAGHYVWRPIREWQHDPERRSPKVPESQDLV